MNTVIFARGYNITGQIELCREYAEHKGYKVEAVIVGQGRDIPAVIGGLDKKIDRVILGDMSRLSRNALENYTIQSELEIDYGILIEDASGQSRNEAEGRLMRNIIAAVREEDRKERAKQEKIFDLRLRGIIE